MPYAAETEVPVQRSKQQIENMLKQRGASQFVSGWDEGGGERLQFKLNHVTVRFTLPPFPDECWKVDKGGRTLKTEWALKKKDQIDRTRWRQLYLVIKAKLEAVEAGIAVYEEEFMAFVVTNSGETIGEIVMPHLQGITSGRRRLLAGEVQ
jgi:hypothetical protein